MRYSYAYGVALANAQEGTLMAAKKKPSQIIASVVIAVAVVAAFALAGTMLASSNPSGGIGDGSSETTTSSAPADAKTVTDMVGRQVDVPADPQHIAAIDSFAAQVCVMSGAGEHVFGVPGGVMSSVLLQKVYPDLPNVERLTGDSINVEALAAGKVDVAFVKESSYAKTGEMDKLDQLGIPYVVVGYETVDEQIAAIELVGTVCGGAAQSKADELAGYYRKTVELVDERTARIPQEERLSIYHTINAELSCDGAGSLGEDWIRRCGAVSVSAVEPATGGHGDYYATLEQIYNWNPDAIICSSADTTAAIGADARWKGMAAVTKGQVYTLPVSMSRWGQRGDPETFLGMLWLGKTLYPQYYADVDLQQTVTEYYRDLFGIDIDEKTWQQILAGEGLREQGAGQNSTSGK